MKCDSKAAPVTLRLWTREEALTPSPGARAFLPLTLPKEPDKLVPSRCDFTLCNPRGTWSAHSMPDYQTSDNACMLPAWHGLNGAPSGGPGSAPWDLPNINTKTKRRNHTRSFFRSEDTTPTQHKPEAQVTNLGSRRTTHTGVHLLLHLRDLCKVLQLLSIVAT